MNTAVEKAISVVRELSEEDKCEVVAAIRDEASDDLVDAWEKADQEAWDREGLEEAERRADEMDKDPSKCLDWEDVYRATKERLKRKREEKSEA